MSRCPFVNLLDPDTYANGMPYEALREIRHAGPVVKLEDPITGVPYWAVTRVEEFQSAGSGEGDLVALAPEAFIRRTDVQ